MRAGRVLSFVVVFALAYASGAAAQTTTRDRAVVVENAPIMLLPDAARQPLRVAAIGTILGAFEEKGDWIRVEFRDPEFGVRQGWVETRLVRIERSNLQPRDLSVLPPDDRPLAPPERVPPVQAAPRVTDFGDPPNRGFIDVNYMSLHPLQKEQVFTFTRSLFRETLTASARYPKLGSIQGFDVGANLLFGRNVGVGVQWLRAEWSGPVGLLITVPHPTLLQRPATDVDVSDGSVLRNENMIDFYVLHSTNRPDWRVAVFGGPTYFRMTYDMVNLINYIQNASPITGTNVVNITTEQYGQLKGRTLGFNAGIDGTWFFSRYVGLGAGLRFNYGTMQVDQEPLSGAPADLRVGATKVVGGARFRF